MRRLKRLSLALTVCTFGAITSLGIGFQGVARADGADTSLCGATNGLATYNGTNAERDLHRAIPDPLKVANYPCNFPAQVRGISVARGTISLVAGGKLVRAIPLAATLGVVTLDQIVQAVNDPTWISMPSPGTVVLSAALVQQRGTSLLVAAPAVKVVRLVTDPGLSMGGSGAIANFQGVTVTSWDTKTGAPVPTAVDGRPFILYENASTLNITDSTFADLGSDETSSYGVSWRVGGTNGTVNHSVFENNFFGVYTFQAANITFENSTFRNNTFYGIDPHTNSTELTITNNNVYGNSEHGIVFSQYVTNSVVENNNVHDNKVNGIMMDFHSDNNVIKNNTVTHNGEGIVFSGSAKNEAFGNTVTNNGVGVRASHAGADGDNVHDNTIRGGTIGVQLYGGATTTVLTNNSIGGASKYGVVVDAERTVLTGNTISGSPTGVRLETVASVSGGSVSASKTGIAADNEAFATVNGVQVSSPTPVRATAHGFVQLVGTAFGSLARPGTGTALGIAGLAILAFALLCELVQLARRTHLTRASVAFAGVPGTAAFLSHQPGRASRLALRPAIIPVAEVELARPVLPTEKKTPEGTTESTTRRFRPDVQGLRAVAVIAVVMSHAALGLPGGYVGVDVFFVISGFLITRQLVEEGDRRGKFSFAKFYARRARRILPAATVVTVATLTAAYFWAPSLRLAAIARDGIAAALFAVNWRMASQGTNYFQASSPPSPFQHYWSLSVEEQFYLAWPLLLAAMLLLFRNQARRTKALVVVLAVLIAVSLWASVYVTQRSEPYGYFSTYTRVWELALGALLAVAAGTLRRVPRRVAALAGWVGLAAIVVACVVFSAKTLYPGIAAALPVAGAGLIIAAGCGMPARFGPERLLKFPPMQWAGNISYSLYLWHWPLLILLPDAVGHSLSAPQRLMAIAVAVVLSGFTYALVEQPFQRRTSFVNKPWRAGALAVGLISISVVTALVVPTLVTSAGNVEAATTPTVLAAMQASTSGGGTQTDAQLAAALAAAAATEQLPTDITPTLAKAPTDFPNTQGCEVGRSAVTPLLPCDQFGDPQGTKEVVLIGDSHAGMWFSSVNAIATTNRWKMASFTKTGCPIADYPDWVDPTLKRTYTECNAWRTATIAHIVAMRPALVIIGSETRAIAANEPTGLETSVEQIEASGAKVAFLADIPSPASIGTVADCLSKHTSNIQACDIPRADAGLDSAGRVAEMQGAQRAGATVIDPSPWMCTATVCPAVIQNVVVYSDGSHMTGTYGLLRAPQLGRALTALLS